MRYHRIFCKSHSHYITEHILMANKTSTRRPKRSNYDISVSLDDALLNKVAQAGVYPLQIVHIDEPFNRNSSGENDGLSHIASQDYINKMVDAVYKRDTRGSKEFFRQFSSQDKKAFIENVEEVYSNWVESISDCLRAAEKAGPKFVWPKGENQKSLEKKQKLNPDVALKKFVIQGVVWHLRWAKVNLRSAPRFEYSGNTMSVDSIRLEAGGRVESWISYNWYKCYRWCTEWKTVKKWKNPFSLSKTGLKVRADFDVFLETNANLLSAKAEAKDLRIDHNIFDRFDLSRIANKFLRDKKVDIYDGNEFKQSIPVIDRTMGISKFDLIPDPKLLKLGVSFKKI